MLTVAAGLIGWSSALAEAPDNLVTVTNAILWFATYSSRCGQDCLTE
jgi:hypothetical protein